MSERDEILISMKPLFERAKSEKLWFYCSYQNLWFSANELETYQKDGKFIWGLSNWSLRNPVERIEEYDREISKLYVERDRFLSKILSDRL